MKKLAIYSEQALTPAALDVLRAAKVKALGEMPVKVTFYGEGEQVPETYPTLVLGKGEGDVVTLSAAQITTKESAITDLVEALRHVMSERQEAPTADDYTVATSVDQLDQLGPIVIVDIETSGDIRTDLPGEVRILCMAFHDGRNCIVLPEELASDPQIVSRLESRTLVAHNSTFDMRYINAALGSQLYAAHDTMLMHYAMNHGAKAHGLEQLAIKFFNADPWEHHVKKYTKGGAHYENIPTDLLHKYNAEDVYWTARLYQLLKDKLNEDPPRRELYMWLMDKSHMIQDIITGGIGVDTDLLERIGERLDSTTEGLLAELQALTGDVNFNPGSWQQVKKYMESFGHPVDKTDEDTLIVAARSIPEGEKALEFIEKLLEYRGTTKLRSTYVTGVQARQRDGKLFPDYLLHGTTTGRLSSRNPNIQNIPRQKEDDEAPIRKVLVTRDEGYLTGSTDYSQIELRVLAEMCGDENMIAAFDPDAPDYFDTMMPSAYPALFKDMDSFYAYLEEHPEHCNELRAKVKAVQYGMNYGRGTAAIALSLNMPVEEAQAIVDGIHERFPKLKVWQEQVRNAVTDLSLAYLLTTPFNRQFQYEVITSRNKNAAQNAALAFGPQSTASDICLKAARAIHERIAPLGARITGLVHDAIYYDFPKDKQEEIIKIVETEMIGSAASVFHRVKFEVETNIGGNWYDI